MHSIDGRSRILLPLLAALMLTAPAGTWAQENQISPPAPLAHPALETNQQANGRFPISLFRLLAESQANTALCAMLMKDAKMTVPANFAWTDCPADFQSDVTSSKGKVSWASGAKPTQCGTDCVGRPFMTQSMFLDRPNTIYAMFYGHLTFAVDVPGPFNRTVTYGYQAEFRCQSDSSGPGSHIVLSVVFGSPVVSDPGILESISSFLLQPVDLSTRITNGIMAQASGVPTNSSALGACNTIGASQAANPADDAVLFNIPTTAPRRPGGGALGSAVVGRTATVHFVSITRRPPTYGVAPTADPGQFQVFLNGALVDIPAVPAAELPASGGSATLDLCKAIDVSGADRLQLIFVNSNGGAAWSQFTSAARLGAGAAHTLTTGRTVVVPGSPGIPNPTTGQTTTGKPHPIVVQEYDLLYTVDYTAAATAAKPVATNTSGGTNVGGRGSVRPGTVGPATLGPRTPATPCRQI